MKTLLAGALAALVICLSTAPAASAGIFGTEPIPVSVGPHGEAANGPSGGAAISGDDRYARLVAFHSSAGNLTPRDTNGAADVFVWSRPHGSSGLQLSRPARPAGKLVRASVSNHGRQADGPSWNPSLDGSMHSRPHCVAFQSSATNLAPGDRDAVSDIYVRDLRSHRTRLVSRGIGAAAVNPAIDGRCARVAFEAGGRVYTASVRGGRPHSLGGGSAPSLSRDGSALVWQRGGAVMLRRAGHTSEVVGSGHDATVSDSESGVWGVSFETGTRLTGNDGNPGVDVYMRVFRGGGGPRRTDLISAVHRGGSSLGGNSVNGGITVYAANRGIVTFANANGGGTTLWYRNNHSGNIDDLAHAGGPIFDIATSARANFVAFSSTAANFRFDGNGGVQDVFFKHLVDGRPL
ncbi:MAG: hypothetical protein ACJ76V_13380 [Thermoleophilaceae bacterium]